MDVEPAWTVASVAVAAVGPLNSAVANPKHLATLREAFMNENGPTIAKDGDELAQLGRPLSSQSSAMNACAERGGGGFGGEGVQNGPFRQP